jgi:hypothetical protein
VARAVGGRVRPLWEVPRPDWLGDELLADLSLVDLGDEARFVAAGERLSAVNIAYRTNALGGFHRAAERTPASAVGQQPEPIAEITGSGGRAVYDPRAAVDYLVPADRLIPEWFRSNAAWRAVSDLLRSPWPTPAAVAERWRAVKDFFFECPPSERTIHGLVLRQDDPRRFQQQISANEFNIANFRNFLSVATNYVRQTLLPCEIVLAGACCDRLANLDYPFVRHMGRVERIDDFYDAVDVVLGPMEFSTGLKIRIGEALSRAKAVVAHRHCFEGYAPTHPFHTLPSFDAMMQACRDIVRAPQLIDDLELASVESMTRALRSVDRALEATLAGREVTAPGLFFVLDLSEVWEGSLALDHVFEAAHYVAHHRPDRVRSRWRCRPIRAAVAITTGPARQDHGFA